jgi:hypothetical protein
MSAENDLKREALKLSRDRAQFANSPRPDEEGDEDKDDARIERAILDEVMRLYQEVVEGKTELLSGEEVFAELRAELD